MRDLTAEWLAKADEDYFVARGLLRRKKVPAASVCFHCQQAVEKLIKAFLQENGIPFGKTHDLEELVRLGGATAAPLGLLSDDLKLLSDYAVKYRYPGFAATVDQARRAATAAKRVRTTILGAIEA